jgi:hypothetical protein
VTRELAYDSRGDSWWGLDGEFHRVFADWLYGHGVDGHRTYRVEFHVVDCPLIRVFQYATGETGRPLVNEAGDGVALCEPFDVMVRTAPPDPADYER